MPTNYDALPEELQWTPQWCIAGPDAKGKYKVPCTTGGSGIYHADPTNPAQWLDFETTREFADRYPPHGLGFVLSASDPYVCIDLDIKNQFNEPDPTKWTAQADIDRFHKIIMAFHSYTERSAGGQGYHIWLRGHTGRGARRDGVEVYSQERFIVCTGDIVIDAPISENQDLLDALLAEMRRGEAPILTLVETGETETDEEIYARAMAAENAAKFELLWTGNWANNGYPSQSEADIALLTMLAFYCKSNAQVMRLFRMSALGKREKAVKNDYYLGTTLKKVRSIAANEEVSSAVGEKMARALVLRLAGGVAAPVPPPVAPNAPQWAAVPPVAPVPPPIQALPPVAAPTGNLSGLGFTYQPEPTDLPKIPTGSQVQYPPGIVGQISKYIFSISPRPIREVSIVAALGLMSGICGRAYCIPQSGLNIYMVLVGQSAIGKEALHGGPAAIVKQLVQGCPEASKFVDYSDFMSAQALTKAVAANPSFVNIIGEFGKKLQRMSRDESGDTIIQQLRTVMTNLYQKSGPGSVFGGLGYSDKEKNVASVNGVAYSMVGETTPGTFYDSLTETMMADGFLSRFTVVEYIGSRPEANEDLDHILEPWLRDHLAALIRNASAINASGAEPVLVGRDDEAAEFLSVFNKKCDREINSTDNEGWRQMWNRAHLKVYRISALLAATENPQFPVINLDQVMWAYDLVMRDIKIMERKIKEGDVGLSDATREKKLFAICLNYLTKEIAGSYGVPDQMKKDGIIPRKFFQVNTQRVTCFTNHKLGQIASLDMTIRSLCDGGYLAEVPKVECIQKYQFHGKCYRILNLPYGTEEKREAAA
jgi:hypothetical protein